MQRLVSQLDQARAWDIPSNDLNGSTTLDVGDVQRVLATVTGLFPQPAAPQPARRVAANTREMAATNSTVESVRLVVDRQTAAAGELVVVRVMIDNLSSPLIGASFSVDYPTDALRLVDSGSHTSGPMIPASTFASIWNVSPSRNNYVTQNGRVSFAASSASLPSGGSGALAVLTFQVQPGAAGQALWPLTLRNCEVTSGGFAVRSLPSADLMFHGLASAALRLARDFVPQFHLPRSEGC
jgi:hypothetical protein